MLSIGPALKSWELIGHDFPPKDIDTLTFVLQAERQLIREDEKEGLLHTERKEPRHVSYFRRSWNSTVQSRNIIVGSSDESGPCVNSGQSISREWHCYTIDGET